MQLAECKQVKKTPALSTICHRAKNFYNLDNFYVRQELFVVENVLTYYDLDFMLRGQPAYQVLPAQTAQQVLRQVAGDWQSFFAACRAYRKSPGKFFGAPRPPRYKPRGGESVAFSQTRSATSGAGGYTSPARRGCPQSGRAWPVSSRSAWSRRGVLHHRGRA